MPSAALLVVGFNSGVVTDVTLTVARQVGKLLDCGDPQPSACQSSAPPTELRGQVGLRV